jgi:predicted RNA-binding Zn-ribbon protein involved in translation (DUF1610 family)
MSKKPAEIIATWCVELNCDCPNCGEYVDVTKAEGFWDGNEITVPEQRTERSNNLEVVCPECGHEFEVCCEY